MAEFGAEKLLWHSKRIEGLLTQGDCYPVQVEFSPTSICNLRCVWCVDREWRDAFPGVMSPALYLEMLDSLRLCGVRGIVFEGGGEPTMHPYFERLVIDAHQKGFDLGLTTNGVLLSTVAHLVPFFSWVRVSLDAYDQDRYLQMKGRDAWPTVMDGLLLAFQIKAMERAKTLLGVSYLLSKDQCDRKKLMALTETLAQMGVNYVQYKRLAGYPDMDPGPLDLCYLDALQRADFAVYHRTEDFVLGNGGLPCLAHALSVQIAGSGDVFVCCRLRQKENDWLGHFGNLHDARFEYLWSGARRRALVSSLRNGAYCQKICPACRMVPYNRAIHAVRDAARSFL